MPAAVRQLPFHKKLAIHLGIFFFRLIILTMRVRFSARTTDFIKSNPRGNLLLVWHNRLALALAAFQKKGKNVPLTGLVSASRDGAALAEVMHAFGVQTVRGSSSRRAVEATRELIECLEAQANVVITPDGPRGPIYTVKKGTAELGSDHAQGIYLLGFNCKSVWRLNSWDKFMFPKPFSILNVDIERVERNISAAELQEKLKELNS